MLQCPRGWKATHPQAQRTVSGEAPFDCSPFSPMTCRLLRTVFMFSKSSLRTQLLTSLGASLLLVMLWALLCFYFSFSVLSTYL